MKREKQQQGPLSVQAVRQTRVLKWEGEPVLKLSLSRPRLPEETRGLSRVNRYYERLCDHWRARWEGQLYQEACQTAQQAKERGWSFQPWEARLDYTVTLNRDDLFSTYIDAYEYAGGAHGNTLRQGDAWQARAGVCRTLRSFYPPRARWRRTVLEELQRQAAQRMAGGETMYFENWSALLVQCFDPDHFYLAEEGICVFYPLYTIAPYAEGIPVFPLPYPTVGAEEEKSGQDLQKNI